MLVHETRKADGFFLLFFNDLYACSANLQQDGCRPHEQFGVRLLADPIDPELAVPPVQIVY